MSDDLLTAVLLTARCPVDLRARHAHRDVGAPGHPRQRRDAARARLHRARSGLRAADRQRIPGRGGCPSPPSCSPPLQRVLARGAAALAPDLAGRTVVVSAGGTREELDPVRYLGNWSSGKQGYALARTAASRGAAGHAGGRQHRAGRPGGRAASSAVRSAAELRARDAGGGRRGRRHRDGRRRRRLPAGGPQRDQDQEGRRAARAHRRWPRIPTSCAISSRPGGGPAS